MFVFVFVYMHPSALTYRYSYTTHRITPLPPRPAPRYVNQIWDLYEDFHVVLMPLLNHEVRGSDKLESFSEHLVDAEDEVEDVE